MMNVILEHVNPILSRKAAFIILIEHKEREITFKSNLPQEVSGKSVSEPNS